VDSTPRLARVDGTGAARRIEVRTTIDADIDTVWNAITQVEQVRHWWTNGIIEPREGGRIVLEDGSEVNGTVIVCRPPYLFEFTWHDSPEESGHPQYIEKNTHSLAKFDLIEAGATCTLLTFVQYVPAAEAMAAAAGWHHIVGERLREFVETDTLVERPGRFSELKAVYATKAFG
jgi:uncharacterized protein YndB with AHSA1/START domain